MTNLCKVWEDEIATETLSRIIRRMVHNGKNDFEILADTGAELSTIRSVCKSCEKHECV